MRTALTLLAALAALLAAACATGAQSQTRLPTIEPLPSATPAAIVLGGKPAAPPAQSSVAAAATAPAAAAAHASATATAAPQVSTAPRTMDGTRPPTSGRWIEVDVSRYLVRLMDGTSVVQEVGPVAVGEQIDTGAYASTQTGTFHVYNKLQALAYDAPYKTYISDWVGFDVQKANGFHSFLKDQRGTVVDASTGRVSNGCIRTGAAEAIFAFATIGMPVYVHS